MNYNHNLQLKENKLPFFSNSGNSLFFFAFIFLVIFPSVNFVFRYVFECILIFFFGKSIQSESLITIKNLVLIIIFLTLTFIHFLSSNSISDAEDLIRIVTFILFFGILINHSTFEGVDFALFVLLVLNIFAVQYFESGDTLNISQYIHARDLENSYGRHSGLFTNVAVLGLFSMIVIVFNFCSIIYVGKKLVIRLISIFGSILLMLESGSKTSMLITFLCLVSILVFRFFNPKSFKSIAIISCVSIIVLYFVSDTIINYNEFMTLVNFLSGDIYTATSVFGRINIWENFLQVSFSRPDYLIFGIPKNQADLISTTYDNDYLWFLVRYGVIGLLTFIIIQFSALKKLIKVRKANNFNPIVMWVFISLGLAAISLGVYTTPQSLTLALMSIAPALKHSMQKRIVI